MPVMHSKQVLTIIFFGVIAGWYGPDLAAALGMRTEAQTGGQDEAEAAERANLAVMDGNRRESWISGDSVLRREKDGHFYANVVVEGRDYRFLVDTGASIVALTAEDAQAMGYTWDDAHLKHIGSGANGAVYGVPVIIERLELAGMEARNVQAAIIPEGLGISLLGQSVLSEFPNVGIRGDEMTLGG